MRRIPESRPAGARLESAGKEKKGGLALAFAPHELNHGTAVPEALRVVPEIDAANRALGTLQMNDARLTAGGEEFVQLELPPLAIFERQHEPLEPNRRAQDHDLDR